MGITAGMCKDPFPATVMGPPEVSVVLHVTHMGHRRLMVLQAHKDPCYNSPEVLVWQVGLILYCM